MYLVFFHCWKTWRGFFSFLHWKKQEYCDTIKNVHSLCKEKFKWESEMVPRRIENKLTKRKGRKNKHWSTKYYIYLSYTKDKFPTFQVWKVIITSIYIYYHIQIHLTEKYKSVNHSTILSFGNVSKLFSYFRYLLAISKMACALHLLSNQ